MLFRSDRTRRRGTGSEPTSKDDDRHRVGTRRGRQSSSRDGDDARRGKASSRGGSRGKTSSRGGSPRKTDSRGGKRGSTQGSSSSARRGGGKKRGKR